MPPSSSPSTPYQRLELPTLVAVVIAVLLILIALCCAASDLLMVGAMVAAGAARGSHAGGFYVTLQSLSIIYWIVAAVLALAVLRWVQVAHDNLQAFNPAFKSDPFELVTGFALPVYNLWYCLQAFETILTQTQPRAVPAPMRLSSLILVRAWWASFLVSLPLSLWTRFKQPPQSTTSVLWHLGAQLVVVGSTLLLIAVLLELTSLQAVRCGKSLPGLETRHAPQAAPAPMPPRLPVSAPLAAAVLVTPAPGALPEAPSAPSGLRPAPNGAFELLAITGLDTGTSFPIEHPEVLIGRREEGVPPSRGVIGVRETSVSKVHAVLAWSPLLGCYAIHHRSTTNLTVVNDQALTSQPLALQPGDRIRMGRLELVLRPRESAASRPDPAVNLTRPVPPWGAAPVSPTRPSLELERLDAIEELPPMAEGSGPLPIVDDVTASTTAAADEGTTSEATQADATDEPGAEGAVATAPQADAPRRGAAAASSRSKEPATKATPFGKSRKRGRSESTSEPTAASPEAPRPELEKALSVQDLLGEVANVRPVQAGLKVALQSPRGERTVTLERSAYILGGNPQSTSIEPSSLTLDDPELASALAVLLYSARSAGYALHVMGETTVQIKRGSGEGSLTQAVAAGQAFPLLPDDHILLGSSELRLSST